MIDWRHRNLFSWILVVGCLLAVVPVAYCGTSIYVRMIHELQSIGSAIDLYHTNNGVYPVTDESGTWYDKLNQGHYVIAGDYYPHQFTDEGMIPTGEYDHPLVYRIIQSGTGSGGGLQPGYLLYSVGRNGIDDHGGLDDWEYRAGPNWGYWYKKDWTEAVVWGAVGSVLILIVFMGCVLWLSRRPGWKMFMITLVGILVFILSAELPVLIKPDLLQLNLGLFDLMQFSAMMSPLFLFVTVIAFFVSIWRMYHLRRLRLVRFQCVECGYDLRGADHERCPECGHVVERGCLSFQG